MSGITRLSKFAIGAWFISVWTVAPLMAESNDGHNQKRIDRALTLMSSGNPAQAAAYLVPAIKASPADRDLWHVYGAALERSGELIEAVAAYRRAAGDKDHRIECLYGLARVHSQLGQFDDAFKAIDDLVDAGFRDYWDFAENPALANLRNDPRFDELPKVHPYRKHSLALDNGESIEYVVVLPTDFNEANAYPVLIALQPAREEWGLTYFWGESAAERGWIVVQPEMSGSDEQSDGGSWQPSTLEQRIAVLLEEIEMRFNVEGDKFHLAGCSAGGLSAFYIGVQYPDWFHSISGLPGIPPAMVSDVDLLNLKGVHVSLFVGDNDSTFWIDRARNTHKKLRRLDVDALLKTLPADGHVPLSLAGDTFMKHMDKVRRKVSAQSHALAKADGTK